MYKWKVEPTFKKSVIEKIFMTKGSDTFVAEVVWRGGIFFVYTEDDSPPILEPGVDIYDCEYESEISETWDSCDEYYHYDECDVQTEIWLNDFFENENSFYDLEQFGWEHTNTTMTIECEMKITKYEERNHESD